MSELNMREVVGGVFEDMSVAEMAMVQGSGDVDAQSTIPCSVLITATAALSTYASGVELVKTVRAHC